jgi:hypothetical protein
MRGRRTSKGAKKRDKRKERAEFGERGFSL